MEIKFNYLPFENLSTMELKRKNVVEYIRECQKMQYAGWIHITDVYSAIRIAEDDARDIAFQAYCNSCIDDCGGCVRTNRGNKPWIGCSVAENFLKHYDNI